MRFGCSALAALAMVATATPAAAQDPAPVVVVTGGLDFVNQYNFRGIRQNTDGMSIWPFVDFGFTPFRGDGGLKTVGLNVGTWNAIHTALDDNKWYESDIYGTVAFGFESASVGVTYTSYTSPADLFAHVKEIALKLSSGAPVGGVSLNPYGLVAFELTDEGQADGGTGKGTYIELGVAPSFAGARASLAVPIKVGLSASNYFEHNMGTEAAPQFEDETFGYLSLGGLVTVPMGAHANIHGGVELQMFGDTLKTKNAFGDDPDDPSGSAVIGSIGLGFAF
jgi:hypothetical protein